MAANTKSVSITGSSSQYLSAGDIPSSSSVTIEYWARVTTFQNYVNMVLGKDVSGSREYGLGWDVTSHQATAQIAGNQVGATTAISTGVWHHYAWVWETSGKTIKLYLDGELDMNTTYPTNPSDTSTPLLIGRRGYSGNLEPYDGYVDEIRIWNVQRTQQEIQDNMYMQIDSETGLVASWHFNDSLADSTGNGYNLTNTGTSYSTEVPFANDIPPGGTNTTNFFALM